MVNLVKTVKSGHNGQTANTLQTWHGSKQALVCTTSGPMHQPTNIGMIRCLREQDLVLI
jgi:hypothetical protein